MTNAYPIPSSLCETEETIKKSRFITFIAHTEGREAANQFIESIRQQHPEARHHCWAFIAGAPNDGQQWGFSDDGEPSGTAGKPILARIQGSGIGEITAVVVRYSGGIKLGTGGLVRAYGGGVAHTLAQLATVQKVPQSPFRISCHYDQLSDVQHLLSRYAGTVIETVYGEQLDLVVTVPTSEVVIFKQDLTNHFRGQLSALPADQ